MKKIILMLLLLFFSCNIVNALKEEGKVYNVDALEGKIIKNKNIMSKHFTARKYILGPNDQINISFLGVPEFDKTNLRVQPDGYITLHFSEPIYVSGLTIAELQTLLNKKYKYFLENPVVSITLVETRPFVVYVNGAVFNPGSYEINTNPSRESMITNQRHDTKIERKTPLLSNILVAAGGINFDADIEHIKITNSIEKTEYEVNLMKMLHGSGFKQDIYLTAGDTVTVPRLPTTFAVDDETYKKYASATFSPQRVPVKVYGYVNSPGVIFLDPAVTLNLNSAITSAGGYLANASYAPKKIFLSRVDQDGKLVTKAYNPKSKDVLLRPNDIIYVPEKTRPLVGKAMDYMTRAITPANTLADTYNNWALMFKPKRYQVNF